MAVSSIARGQGLRRFRDCEVIKDGEQVNDCKEMKGWEETIDCEAIQA